MIIINNYVFKKVYDNTWCVKFGNNFSVFTEHLVLNISEENNFKKGLRKVVMEDELDYLFEEFKRDFLSQQNEEEYVELLEHLRLVFDDTYTPTIESLLSEKAEHYFNDLEESDYEELILILENIKEETNNSDIILKIQNVIDNIESGNLSVLISDLINCLPNSF